MPLWIILKRSHLRTVWKMFWLCSIKLCHPPLLLTHSHFIIMLRSNPELWSSAAVAALPAKQNDLLFFFLSNLDFFFFANSDTSQINAASTVTQVTGSSSSSLLQHWRQVCVEFQALWNVWKGAAQSGGIHPGQEVTLFLKVDCHCGPSQGVSDKVAQAVG